MRERDDSGGSSGTAARSARIVFRSIKAILAFLLRSVDFFLRHLTASKLRDRHYENVARFHGQRRPPPRH